MYNIHDVQVLSVGCGRVWLSFLTSASRVFGFSPRPLSPCVRSCFVFRVFLFCLSWFLLCRFRASAVVSNLASAFSCVSRRRFAVFTPCWEMDGLYVGLPSRCLVHVLLFFVSKCFCVFLFVVCHMCVVVL